LLNLFKTGWDM